MIRGETKCRGLHYDEHPSYVTHNVILNITHLIAKVLLICNPLRLLQVISVFTDDMGFICRYIVEVFTICDHLVGHLDEFVVGQLPSADAHSVTVLLIPYVELHGHRKVCELLLALRQVHTRPRKLRPLPSELALALDEAQAFDDEVSAVLIGVVYSSVPLAGDVLLGCLPGGVIRADKHIHVESFMFHIYSSWLAFECLHGSRPCEVLAGRRSCRDPRTACEC